MITNEVLVEGGQEIFLPCFNNGTSRWTTGIVHQDMHGMRPQVFFDGFLYGRWVTEVGDDTTVLLAERKPGKDAAGFWELRPQPRPSRTDLVRGLQVADAT